MPLRPRPNISDYFLLAALATMWGTAFLLIKIAVSTVPPFTNVALRLLVATLFMITYVYIRGERLPATIHGWALFALVGLFGNVIPFALIGWGETRLDSSLAAILVATVPLFTSVLAHFFTKDEPLSFRSFTGVCIGLAGVMVLVGWDVIAGLGAMVLSQVSIIVAAFSYACTNILARHVILSSASSASTATLICALVWVVPLSVVIDEPWSLNPSANSILAIVTLGLVSTTLAYIVYFRLIRTVGATFVSLVNYLIPPIGVGLGIFLGGEEPNFRSLLALFIILVGIIVTRRA